MALRGLGSLLALLVLAGVAFAGLSPQLGGTPTKTDQARFARSGHYQDGKFQNQLPTEVMTGGSTFGLLKHFLFDKPQDSEPPRPLPTHPLDSAAIGQKPASGLRVTWFGHSASLVEIGGQNILFDPMLSVDMGPLSWVTPRRYNPLLAISPAQLPAITAVVISHDHYDHLDYQTIRQLKDKTQHFIVPLGVGAHLRAWHVAESKIHELDWHDSLRLPGAVTVISQPARHFSGRGLRRGLTSWSSWVLRGPRQRVFYSGDGGYGPHFQQIGQQYGPFDLALMECGQYDPQWSQIHMTPEQSVQAGLDVRARLYQPVHWGAFTEALHPWNEPVRRAWAEATRRGLPITTPELGQPVLPGASTPPRLRWWQ